MSILLRIGGIGWCTCRLQLHDPRLFLGCLAFSINVCSSDFGTWLDLALRAYFPHAFDTAKPRPTSQPCFDASFPSETIFFCRCCHTVLSSLAVSHPQWNCPHLKFWDHHFLRCLPSQMQCSLLSYASQMKWPVYFSTASIFFRHFRKRYIVNKNWTLAGMRNDYLVSSMLMNYTVS